MSEDKDTPGDETTQPPYTSGPYYTWSLQTVPPSKERREDDPEYGVMRVHNSHSPGLIKQGRLIRPVTKADAELPIWIVDIEGTEITVHSPEEAWY